MRFNNKKETNIVPSLYIIIVAVFITNIFAAVEIKYEEVPFNYYSLIPNLLAILLAIYLFMVAKYFEFDSDGETLNFKASGLMVSKFMPYREHRTEIPKSKLIDFKIENYWFYRRLHIFITSRNKKGFRQYKYNITFLSSVKRKSLRQSLAKVVEQNKARA